MQDMQQQSEQKGNSSSDMGRSGILSLNNLSYSMSPDLAVAVSRSVTSQFFQSQTYSPGSTAVVIMNTGSAYVNMQQSTLQLDVRNDSNAAAFFGPSKFGCSATNLINRITILSRSGQILERVERCNQYAAIKLMYGHDRGYRAGPATAYGAADVAISTPTQDGLDWLPGETLRFCIPLGEFSSLCDTVGSLWPSQLASGLRIELVFESADNALVSNGTEVIPFKMDYAVVGCKIQAESYLLSDLVMRSLNEASARQGLEVVGVSVFNNQSSRASKILNIDVGKSCSRALTVCHRELPGFPGVKATNVSSFETVKYTAISHPTEAQYRIGSLYYPQSSIRALNARTVASELFMQTARAFGKLHQTMGVSTGVGLRDFTNGSAVIAQDLERSSVLELSGVPLSNSRSLVLNLAYTDAPAQATTVDLFLSYVTLIRVFGSNCTVEI